MLERHVERIEPDDRAAALVNVLVPGPGRREDQVALLHRTGLAVDDGGRAGSLEHEPQRVHGVAMRPRLLARQQDLDVGGERARGLLLVLALGNRRHELQHAPFDRLRRGDLDGAR